MLHKAIPLHLVDLVPLIPILHLLLEHLLLEDYSAVLRLPQPLVHHLQPQEEDYLVQLQLQHPLLLALEHLPLLHPLLPLADSVHQHRLQLPVDLQVLEPLQQHPNLVDYLDLPHQHLPLVVDSLVLQLQPHLLGVDFLVVLQLHLQEGDCLGVLQHQNLGDYLVPRLQHLHPLVEDYLDPHQLQLLVEVYLVKLQHQLGDYLVHRHQLQLREEGSLVLQRQVEVFLELQPQLQQLEGDYLVHRHLLQLQEEGSLELQQLVEVFLELLPQQLVVDCLELRPRQQGVDFLEHPLQLLQEVDSLDQLQHRQWQHQYNHLRQMYC